MNYILNGNMTSKEILDKWATAIVPKEAIFSREGQPQVNQDKIAHYEERGYKGDEVLWIAPKDCIRIEFEDETNKIGQKTKFEKGHLHAHLAGGDTSEENITAICKYCNSFQKDMFSYDPSTGKKIYHLIPLVKNQLYQEKIEVLTYLLNHMKRKDVIDLIKKIKLTE